MKRPWALSMRWHDLLFLHWPVPPEMVRPLLPMGLELDLFEGRAWLGVVPFRMEGVRPRGLPRVSRLSNFPELNLRTYVTDGRNQGVWFFSLDAHNPLAVRLARAGFHLPYFDAEMACVTVGDEVRYRSVRMHKNAPEARFRGRYQQPTEEPFTSREGTLEHFLTERYCLYSADAKGHVYRGDIHHARWPLQRAEAEVMENTLAEGFGLTLPDTEPHRLFSKRLEVVAWLPRRV